MDICPAKVNGEDFKKEALKICQDFLGQPWKSITISEFGFSTVSGGLSNTLYCCSLPDDVPINNPTTPRQVLLRIYGPIQDEANVIIIEATTFMLLAERKLGPKLYGVFSNGRLEEYIPSRSLSTDDIRKMSTTVAKELAKIHALEVPVKKNADFFTIYLTKWLQNIEKNHMLKYNATFPLGKMYKEESDWLKKEMELSQSPIVYCHNDLQGGNILFREDSISEEEPSLVLIDFEFGAYNYRGFDIANQFSEWIFDYCSPEVPYFTTDYSKYPTKEERTRYIRAYVDQLVLEGAIQVESVETEVRRILEEIKVFGMVVHLLWSLWSEKMIFVSNMDFCHREHSKVRREIFMRLKEKYLKRKSHCCNGNSELSSRNE